MTRAHVLSALLGSAFAIAVVTLLSMSQVLPAGQHVIVGYGPNPRDMVQIQGVTPYVVPPGKVFTLTAIGATASINNGCSVHLYVNGSSELTAVGAVTSETSTVKSVPAGFTVPGGATITLSGDAGCNLYDTWLRAWGYLADQ
jgi:hypothetical protein